MIYDTHFLCERAVLGPEAFFQRFARDIYICSRVDGFKKMSLNATIYDLVVVKSCV